jgi:hypothetical protein
MIISPYHNCIDVGEPTNLKSANLKLATLALLFELGDEKGDDFAEKFRRCSSTAGESK